VPDAQLHRYEVRLRDSTETIAVDAVTCERTGHTLVFRGVPDVEGGFLTFPAEDVETVEEQAG
jgi:hypothetical protein